MELSAKFAGVPPRQLLECFAQCQKISLVVQTGKNYYHFPSWHPYIWCRESTVSRNIQRDRCFCSWRKMLSPAWCCDIWIVPHSLAVPDILQCISEVSGEKKQKDRKEGCAESQTKVEFMGKWTGEGQRRNRKLRLWTSPVMPQVLVLPVCCLTTAQSAQWLQWELGCWAALSMRFVCWSCSCGGEVAETHCNECASQLAALATGSCAGTRSGSGEETLICVWHLHCRTWETSDRGGFSDHCSAPQGASACWKGWQRSPWLQDQVYSQVNAVWHDPLFTEEKWCSPSRTFAFLLPYKVRSLCGLTKLWAW